MFRDLVLFATARTAAKALPAGQPASGWSAPPAGVEVDAPGAGRCPRRCAIFPDDCLEWRNRVYLPMIRASKAYDYVFSNFYSNFG